MISFVGWRPIRDDGEQEWVQMRSGPGEGAWWHRHPGELDYGGNPVDDGKCRTCGASHSHEEDHGA
jgi:hypothetical protein